DRQESREQASCVSPSPPSVGIEQTRWRWGHRRWCRHPRNIRRRRAKHETEESVMLHAGRQSDVSPADENEGAQRVRCRELPGAPMSRAAWAVRTVGYAMAPYGIWRAETGAVAAGEPPARRV